MPALPHLTTTLKIHHHPIISNDQWVCFFVIVTVMLIHYILPLYIYYLFYFRNLFFGLILLMRKLISFYMYK